MKSHFFSDTVNNMIHSIIIHGTTHRKLLSVWRQLNEIKPHCQD